MGAFGIEAGDYIVTLKGAVDPHFFFSTTKEVGENLMLDSTRDRYFKEFDNLREEISSSTSFHHIRHASC
ncbi:hypothetical protein KEJ34_09375 [Candidatus Bathyarchaeota archaeon]|nr:hypothetical protein [Candidatus Bathyarchaeota archaeon]